MAVNTDKHVTLERLKTYDTLIKGVISTESGKAVKAVGFSSDGLKMLLYKTVDKSDTPIEVDVPAELLKDWFFDVTKSGIVENFAWSEITYPNTTDPSLDGKPVVVFALSKGDDTSYSFASLESLIDTFEGEDSTSATTTVANGKIKAEVKISTKEGNGLNIDPENGGLYVNAAGKLDYATDDDINALFAASTTPENPDNTDDTESNDTP